MSVFELEVRRIVKEEIAAATFATPEGDPWLSAPEAAAYLKVSVGTVHNLVSEGRLPRHAPKGCRLYFRRSELEAYRRRSA